MSESEQALGPRESKRGSSPGNSAAMVAYADKEARFRYVNASYANFFARQPAEFIGRTISEVLGEARWREVGPLFRHALTGNEASYQRSISGNADDERMIQVTLVPFEREGAIEGVLSLGQDITDWIRVDQKRRESATRLHQFGDIIPAMVAYCDAQYVCHYANRRFLEFYVEKGVSVEGKRMAEVLTAATIDSARPHVERVLAGEAVHYQTVRNRRDGELRHVDVTVEPDRDKHGAVIGAHFFVFDVTEGRRAEIELRARESQLRLLTENIPAMICYNDANLRHGYSNRSYREFYTGSDAPLDGKAVNEVVGEEIWREARGPVLRALGGEAQDYRVKRRRRADGSMRDLDVAIVPHRDEDGRVLGMYVLIIDVTRRRRAEEALRLRNLALDASEARFRAIFERSKAGIAMWGLDGRFFAVNDAYCDFVGYSAADLVGKMSAGDLRHPGEDEGLDLTGRMLRGEVSHITRDRRYRRRDASTVWGRTTVAAVGGKDEEPQYFIAVVIDITEGRKAHERIEKMNAELEDRVEERTVELSAALKELDSFAYSVSHDLRAPIGAISGFAHLLRTHEARRLSDDGKHLLEVIERNSEHAVNLVESILELSQLGRGHIRRIPLSMSDLASAALRGHQGAPIAEIRVGVLPDCDGDPVLLGQVWANLLGNALKYSRTRKPARIEVGWDDGKLAYFVRDNGVGFDMKYANKLFGAFERLHNVSEFEGSGIGLAIVQRIIERHGGAIWAEAAIDCGATFWFTVPGRR